MKQIPTKKVIIDFGPDKKDHLKNSFFMNNELYKVENLPQLVKSLGSIVGAVGSLAPISLHSSNSMSILKGAIQSEIEGIS